MFKTAYFCIKKYMILSCVLLFIWQVEAAESNQIERDDCGFFDKKLDIEGRLYNVSEAKVGDVLEEGIVFVPTCLGNSNSNASITIQTSLAGLNKEVLHSIFFQKDPRYIETFPFSARGVESILSPNIMLFKIHRGTLVNLGKIKTGSSKFIVRSIVGKVYITVGFEGMEEEFDNFYSSYILPKDAISQSEITPLSNGGTSIVISDVNNLLPKRYEPRVAPHLKP